MKNKRFIIYAMVVAFGVFISVQSLSAEPIRAKQMPPASLVRLGESSEAAYDMAKARQWRNLTRARAAIERDAEQLNNGWHDLDEQYHLTFNINALRSATRDKNQIQAMSAANQVTLYAARLSEQFTSRIPVEVTLLDVYGRDLEIAGLNGDGKRLSSATGHLRGAWNGVRGAVQKRNTKTARTFESLLARVEAASTPAAAKPLATPILDQVDEIEKVFLR